MRKTILLTVLIIAAIVAPIRAAHISDTEIPKLQSQLTTASTPQDSVRLLYDIFDLGNRQQKVAAAEELFAVAGRAGDVEAQLDILRLVTSYIGATTLPEVQQRAASLPDSKLRRETELFLDIKETQLKSRRQPFAEQSKQIAGLVNKLNSDSIADDPYQKLLTLYMVTAALRNTHNTEMLTPYMDSLINLVESSNFELYALRNIIYTEAAMIYTGVNDSKRAIAADRKLLNVVDGLEKYYQQKGRKYRNFQESRYNIYRRMMRNYQALSQPEVDHLYARIMELAAQNPTVAADVQHGYLKAYYAMAKGNYKEAVPRIKKSLEDSLANPVKMQLLKMLIDASRNTGDTATLLSALDQYTLMLDDQNSNFLPDKIQELQVAYDVSNLKAKNAELQLQSAMRDKKKLQDNMLLLTAVWIICILAIILLLLYWSRYRKRITVVNNLADSVTRQRDQIKYKRYHEYDAPEKYPTKYHHKSMPMGKLLESMLSDALYISALGREEREKHRFAISLSHIISDVEKGVKRYHGDNLKLQTSAPEEDLMLNTDRECMVYLLARIIMTAMDRSQSNLQMNTEIDRHNGTIRFILTHQGKRIPVGSEEILFNEFVHFDYLNNLDDSALFLCRLNAFLLQCAITYNPYADGEAKLIIAMPINTNI